jgi:hypothetical protein
MDLRLFDLVRVGAVTPLVYSAVKHEDRQRDRCYAGHGIPSIGSVESLPAL